MELIRASVGKTRAVVVIEEHMTNGGLGDDVLRVTWDIEGMQYASASIPNQFVRGYGNYKALCDSVRLTPGGVADLVRASFSRSS